jgi:hypothetical protein
LRIEVTLNSIRRGIGMFDARRGSMTGGGDRRDHVYRAGLRRLIDPRAVIDAGAELDEGVEVGPFSVIGAGVRSGPAPRSPPMW